MNRLLDLESLSVTQILIGLADLPAPKQPPLSTNLATGTLDTMVSRAFAIEGGKDGIRGELITATERLIGLSPNTFLPHYRTVSDYVTTQYEKIGLLIKEIERKHPSYFTEADLKKTFLEEPAEAFKIRGNYLEIKQGQKGPTSFTAKAQEQRVELALSSLREDHPPSKLPLPELVVFKKGKTPGSIAEKVARYIVEHLPFIESGDPGVLDPTLLLTHYRLKKVDALGDPVAGPLLARIASDHLTAFARSYAQWRTQEKELKRLRNAEEEHALERRMTRGHSPRRQALLDRTLQQAIKDAEGLLAKKRQEVVRQIGAHRQALEPAIAALPAKDVAGYLTRAYQLLGNNNDHRGINLIMPNGTDVEALARWMIHNDSNKVARTYIPGSFEDHAKKKHRKSTYAAVHFQLKAVQPLFEDEEKQARYASANRFEVQLETLDDHLRATLGVFDHVHHKDYLEHERSKEYSPAQQELYDEIRKRMEPLALAFEQPFKTLFDVRASRRETADDYREALVAMAPMVQGYLEKTQGKRK